MKPEGIIVKQAGELRDFLPKSPDNNRNAGMQKSGFLATVSRAPGCFPPQ
jgi:hypothetical protein